MSFGHIYADKDPARLFYNAYYYIVSLRSNAYELRYGVRVAQLDASSVLSTT